MLNWLVQHEQCDYIQSRLKVFIDKEPQTTMCLCLWFFLKVAHLLIGDKTISPELHLGPSAS